MKLRKWLTSILAAGAMATAGSASAVVVGGINFGDPGTSHLETTTIAETFVNGVGQTLTGYGQINTINGETLYCTADVFCRLFFTFTYEVTSFDGVSGEVSFDNGMVNVYYDPVGLTYNLQNQSSAANLAYISALAEWVQLEGHAFAQCGGDELCAEGTLTGTNLAFTGSGLLDVVFGAFGLASVQSYLDGNSEGDGLGGFADITITTSGSSSVLNQFDTCNFQPGEWCISGSADLRGQTNLVPEPGTLLLMGFGLLGLLGAGAVARRRRF